MQVRGRIVRPRREVEDGDGFATRQSRAGIVVYVRANANKLVRDFLSWCDRSGIEALPVEVREFARKDQYGTPVPLRDKATGKVIGWEAEERPTAYQCDVFGATERERYGKLCALVERKAVLAWHPVMSVGTPGSPSLVRADRETGIPLPSARDFAPKFRKPKGKPKVRVDAYPAPDPMERAPKEAVETEVNRDDMNEVYSSRVTLEDGRTVEKEHKTSLKRG